MTRSPVTPESRYAGIVDRLGRSTGVTTGSGKKGFGASALQVKGKIFAMMSTKGHFVVKLSRERVDALIASGRGERFDPGHGRVMKEWLVVDPTFGDEWLLLAKEALKHVGSGK